MAHTRITIQVHSSADIRCLFPLINLGQTRLPPLPPTYLDDLDVDAWTNSTANPHSGTALWDLVRFVFIQHECVEPLSPSMTPQPAPVQLAREAHASMHASRLRVFSLPMSMASPAPP